MHPDILPLLGQPYCFINSPGIETSNPGMNCQSAVHRIFDQVLGIKLPPGLWSKEIFEDKLLFNNLDPGGNINTYDVAIFGPTNNNDPRQFHLACFVDHLKEPRLIHGTAYDGQVSLWNLSQFFTKPRYAELKRIKRFKLYPLPNSQPLSWIYPG